MSSFQTDAAPTPSSTRELFSHVSPQAWGALALISVGHVLMALNWYNVAASFGLLDEEFGTGLPALALLISAFLLGYGAMHIPAGVIATRIGIRRTIALGLIFQGITAAVSGLVSSYEALLVVRILCGASASLFAGIAIAGVSVWFTGRAHAFALGTISAAYSVGVTLGLYLGADLAHRWGWRPALVVCGLLGVLGGAITWLLYRSPVGLEKLHGGALVLDEVRAVLRSRGLWLYGLSFAGGYGAYFAAAQLLGQYAGAHRAFGPDAVGLAMLLIGLGGIPGSLFTGWLSDRLRSRGPVLTVLIVLLGLALISIPFTGESWFWLPAFVVGFTFNGSFGIWETAPAERLNVPVEHLGTAVGVMLTITAVGGFLIPWLFGLIADAAGFSSAWIFAGVVTIAGAGLIVGGPARRSA